MGSSDLLAELTARLASTARLDEIADMVAQQILALGFGGVWIAVLDEPTGMLSTLKSVVDGVDITDAHPKISRLDLRQPIGHGFREHRMFNVADPSVMQAFDRDDDVLPPDQLALPRAVYDHLRGHPLASGPLFGSRGQPVGALGLTSYRGAEPIPDEMLSQGLLPTFMDHLGIAMERAVLIEQLDASLSKAQATILADARIKAVGEVAAAVAHDLNNLAGIALLAVSAGLRSPADAFDMLPRIERATRAIGDLVARLQRLARPAASEPELANLQQIVDDILIMIKPMLHEQSIEVDAELPAVRLVRCDAVLVHQVVLNLVVNATDALAEVPADRRRIQIRLRDDDGTVRLTVADTGPGIAPEMLTQLFQPFVTTKRNAHLGLGLAAAHASLQLFGGQIEGHNAASGGAVFEVTLPVAPPGTPARTSEPPRPRAAPAARSARIFAIDDDPDVVDIIQVYLEPLGYVVSTATGSTEAIEMARSQPFDLVLCDVGMPRQNGIEVCRALRETGYRGKLVLMTGWENYGSSDEQRAVACDALLKKPFVGAELIQVIDALLGGRPAAPS
ncbi:MAG: response regulator [Deltaproteobacteria bacterium]|nr:MAG: response regulator [Deltaproteobacteria bacterium]TMQ11396.1 MAG: response regulator [Deltaproteobacteria bacterium]